MFSVTDVSEMLLRLWPFILAIIVIAAIASLFGRKKPRGYEYRLKECIMTKVERACFTALETATQGQYLVFPQIHFDALLEHKISGQNNFGAFKHINEKSVDFVLCEKGTLRPILAVERDDPTHEWRYRQKRDKEEERIFAEVGLPLLRVRGQDSEDVPLLIRLINEKLNPSPTTAHR